MDRMKLFTLLIAVTCVQIMAEGPKKKIRIHLPQRVKHIHHHKKIYITNYPAPTQYAPAFMPNAEGAVAVPTNVAIPTVADIVPLNSMDIYDESQGRLLGVSSAASKILPLYRARGYYGPMHSDWSEKEYDSSAPPEPPTHGFVPTAFSSPSVTGAASSVYPSKRIKILPRKKTGIRKIKPKHVTIRPHSHAEEELPVSPYHEQFYSDIGANGAVRKIKKPQRVEKIVDGDTEHVHTYSEEHIHKIVYDNHPKLTGIVGVNPINSMSALAAVHPIIPIKNTQVPVFPSDSISGMTAITSIASPSPLEFTAFNTRDVTHDHIFHDHGEIPADMEITKDTLLGLPPKVSYNSQGLPIFADDFDLQKSKFSRKYVTSTKPTPTNDFSYYENIFMPKKVKKSNKPIIPIDQDDSTFKEILDDYRPIPSFKFKDNEKHKTPNEISVSSFYNNGKQQHKSDYRNHQSSVSGPFSVTSTVIHDYNPNTFTRSEPTGFSKIKDPFVNFKDSYLNNFEYDTYALPSNYYKSSTKNDNSVLSGKNIKSKRKSISRQNINFGSLDHRSMLGHIKDFSEFSNNDGLPVPMENFHHFDKKEMNSIAISTTPKAYVIKESSPSHGYYLSMAARALQSEQLSIPEASNDNFQYVSVPTPYSSSTEITTMPILQQYKEEMRDSVGTKTLSLKSENRPSKKEENKITNLTVSKRSKQIDPVTDDYPITLKSNEDKGNHATTKKSSIFGHTRKSHNHATRQSGKIKYGDKI